MLLSGCVGSSYSLKSSSSEEPGRETLDMSMPMALTQLDLEFTFEGPNATMEFENLFFLLFSGVLLLRPAFHSDS